MKITNNITALNAVRQLNKNQKSAASSMAKLSSGYKINTAADDAAGLAISEKMRAQIRGLKQASKNSEEAISLIQTAEGALNELTSILQRMRELAVKASTETLEEADAVEIKQEFDNLINEIDDIATKTKFNRKALFDSTQVDGDDDGDGTSPVGDDDDGDGTSPVGDDDDGDGTSPVGDDDDGDGTSDGTTVPITTLKFIFQTGANEGDTLTLEIADVRSVSLQFDGSDDISDQAEARTIITKVDDALKFVYDQRAKLGAVQNRLEYKISNLDSSAQNLQSAESVIRDVDMAEEMVNYTSQEILQNAAQAMLARANQAPQAILQLLQ